MATSAENLQTRYNEITQILANNQTADGQSLLELNVIQDGEVVPCNEYIDRLYRELDNIDRALKHGAAQSAASLLPGITQVRPR